MTRIINGYNTIKVQVESDRVDVWSPDGLAISNGRHDVKLSDLASIDPMGISKSGNQTGFNHIDWTPVTSFTVRTGYTSTVLENDGITVQQKHRGIIKFNAFFTRIWNYKMRLGLRIKINGVVAREITHNTYKGAVIYIADFEPEDVVTVEAQFEAKKTSYFSGTTYQTGTLLSTSYLTIEKYDRAAIDFQYDMCYDTASDFYFTDNLSTVGPDFGKAQPQLYNVDVDASYNDITGTVNTTVTKDTVHSWGPVVAQSLVPIPVEEGYVVDMSGKFRMRRPGIAQEANFFGNDVNVRFSVWGKGFTEDEYGQNPVDVELIYHEAVLQSTTASGLIDITLPDLDPVVVPENVNRVYFTCVLVNADDGTLMPVKYKNNAGGISGNFYFGWYNSDPLKIMITPPDDKVTYEHTLSLTGVGYKNRRFFTNVAEPKTLTFMGGVGRDTTISVYKYNMTTSTRGSLIGTYAAAADERKQISVVSDTGAIEIDSSTVDPTDISRTKSGDMAPIPESGTTDIWVDVTGYTGGASNVVTISDSGLATITCSARFSDATFPSGRYVSFLVNGERIASWQASGAIATGSYQMYLNAGDQVKMQVKRRWAYDADLKQADTFMTINYGSAKKDYFVESLLAETYDEMYETQTVLERITWQDISDDLNSVVAIREEFDAGSLKLKFVSDVLSDGVEIAPGKRIRLLAINYGENETATGVQGYEVLFTGTVREFEVKYNYKGRPNVELEAFDAFKAAEEADGHYYYDLPMELAPMLHGLGKPVVIDGVEVSGPYSDAPDGFKNMPSSYREGLKVKESLEAVRNTNKGFVYVDKHDTIQYLSALDEETIDLVVGDAWNRADISYGKIEKGTSTDSIINLVKPEERSFDLDTLSSKTVSNKTPIQNMDEIPAKNQVAKYYFRSDSIQNYGERSETFPVVRGTGDPTDIKLGDFGGGFRQWAIDILNDYDLHHNRVSRIMLVPRNFHDIKRISELDVFSQIRIFYKNEQHIARVRRIEWHVVPNAVRVEIFFDRSKGQSAWVPVVETGESWTDTWFDVF